MAYGIEDEVWDEIESWAQRASKTQSFIRDDYMAKILMVELVRAEIAEPILLKNDSIRNMWDMMVQEARKQVNERKRKELKRQLRISGASKLTAEERRLFKIPDPESM